MLPVNRSPGRSWATSVGLSGTRTTWAWSGATSDWPSPTRGTTRSTMAWTGVLSPRAVSVAVMPEETLGRSASGTDARNVRSAGSYSSTRDWPDERVEPTATGSWVTTPFDGDLT